jgi:hypothetical protein
VGTMIGPIDSFEQPTLPSHLTLVELRMLLVFATMLAHEQEISEDGSILIGIIVRDRGEPNPLDRAPWIEFSVGEKRYAFWRRTMACYEVGPDGAVSDDPIYHND